MRAHEILEDALHQAVTGIAEPHIHTGIDDVVAATRGTRFVLGTLQALVERADAARWLSIGARLDRLDRVLDGLAASDGTHVRDDALTARQRAALTSALDGALEELAWLPGLIEPSGGS